MNGIDVSVWQGAIDWKKVKASGKVQFVILREGYRQALDTRFVEYLRGCREVGLPVVGVYHFIYSLTAEQARAEAASCVNNCIKYGLSPDDIIVWADLEYDNTAPRAQQRGICEAFCEEVKRLGYKAGIYLNADYLVHVYGKDIAQKYDIWLADWTGAPDYPCLYQQTGVGKAGYIDGISTTVDLDTYIGQHTAVSQPDTPKKSIDELAQEVLEGKWSSGNERKKLLTDAGYDYSAVQKRVNELLTKPKDEVTSYSVTMPRLAKGSKSEAVRAMQALLVIRGMDIGRSGTDGDFGNDTENAVKLYQAKCKLTADGIVNDATWKKLLGLS